ncbi:MAG: tryptophan--tRNA ligase [Candidatus Cloacimonetes bacterium]|jgi:tryptophanyl-tRNA synthetase|nr:tryptophan--tRNA ligase [Candidatus Cloacimonadota bacterium]MBT4332340.1 tryptophan--tRNA ligase [Candidatus Cloacimonadota bacterium]MBT4575591.1 tryptophan--tRNA ligase [Candidatus Cloacimonadota bacterium]
MNKGIALTGIKPTGTPHIGNYFGAIKPAIELTKEYDARYFIADYHALNTIKDPQLINEMTYEVAATWLACGLDPKNALVYRQSQVPQTFDLSTILLAFTSKGLMNRAHAYKAMVQSNNELKRDQDDGVNMGLFTYPVLMAADILLFDSDVVPVGKDQAQHLEMTIDIAQSVNHIYKKDVLTIPKPLIREATQTVIGLDGRKMSKSYNNTIPLFLPTKKLRKLIMKVVTNSQTIEEVKDPDKCNVFTLYKLFTSNDQQNILREKYLAGGMGWGHAKQELFEVMEEMVSPMREKYDELMNNKDFIDKLLDEGSEKAQEIASEKMKLVKNILGFK